MRIAHVLSQFRDFSFGSAVAFLGLFYISEYQGVDLMSTAFLDLAIIHAIIWVGFGIAILLHRGLAGSEVGPMAGIVIPHSHGLPKALEESETLRSAAIVGAFDLDDDDFEQAMKELPTFTGEYLELVDPVTALRDVDRILPAARLRVRLPLRTEDSAIGGNCKRTHFCDCNCWAAWASWSEM